MMRLMGTLGFLGLLAAGCVNPQARMQMAEENEKERDLSVLTIGDVTEVANVAPIKVQGVGLVTGLAGTGHCPAGYYRNLLEQYLLKSMGPRNGQITDGQPDVKVKKVLNDPANALVLVQGFIPAGARRGDVFDVEINLPQESKATSLAGGYLELCMLRVYESAAKLSGKHSGDSTLLASQIFGQAKGQLVVGFGGTSDSHELKAGRVWLGGVSRLDRPYAFVMKTGKSWKNPNLIAQRINFMYQDDPHSPALLSEQKKNILLLGSVTDQLNQQANAGGLVQSELAKAVSKEALNLRVPLVYRFNHERYLRVARLTPLGITDAELARYQQRLKKMLLEPHETMRAALRLEALGRDSIPLLKDGLESVHPLVRFCSAEALAYLGSTYAIDMLTQVAQEQTLFAYPATLALAGLGETICHDKLGELLACPEPVVRAAAFHALSLLDENDVRLGGICLRDTFWLNRLVQAPTPLITYTTSKRPQIVLSGRNLVLEPAARMFVGKDFTVVTGATDGQCTVKRITTQGEQKRVCSQRVEEILLALSDLNASYPDIVDFLRKAHDYRKINCPVITWSNPETSLEALLEVGVSKQ